MALPHYSHPRPSPHPAERSGRAGMILLLLAVGLGAMGAVVVFYPKGEPDQSPPPTSLPASTTTASDGDASATSTTTTEAPGASEPVGATVPELARATALLVQLDGSGSPACFSGSGSIVTSGGRILTNAHVVWNDPTCPYEQLGVAITDTADEVPTLTYLADVLVYDEFLDLAVVEISRDLSGNPVADLDLPFVRTGDSDSVSLGDELRILGFPGIGGDTITLTEGAVSGFVSERGVDETRAWIKTDATIAGGNSGGMAVNAAGELVGVPTQAGAGDSVTTDCRVIQDTNGDGNIDGADSCIPIGGFINGLRPVNLARSLLADADSATPVVPQDPSAGSDTFDVDSATVSELVFTSEIVDDAPTEIVTALPSGRPQVCAHWAYDQMVDGVTWDAVWRVDGIVNPNASFIGETWLGGPSGTWWACAQHDDAIVDGLYEFEIAVEGTVIATNSIFVGGDRQPATLTIGNESAVPICYVQISPTLAGYWGPDDLGETEIIEVDAVRPFTLVTGRYDLRLSDCNAEVLLEVDAFELTSDDIIAYRG